MAVIYKLGDKYQFKRITLKQKFLKKKMTLEIFLKDFTSEPDKVVHSYKPTFGRLRQDQTPVWAVWRAAGCLCLQNETVAQQIHKYFPWYFTDWMNGHFLKIWGNLGSGTLLNEPLTSCDIEILALLLIHNSFMSPFFCEPLIHLIMQIPWL